MAKNTGNTGNFKDEESIDLYREVFTAIQASGMKLDREDDNRQTDVTVASSIGNPEIFQLLINPRAKDFYADFLSFKDVLSDKSEQKEANDEYEDDDYKDQEYEDDELLLHSAAEAGHLEIVRFLLDAGANVEGYEEDDWTALMGASSVGHLPIVQLLVERGADVNAWSRGETPLMLAARGVHLDVYDFLYPLVSDEIRAIGDRDATKEMVRTIRYRTREQNKPVKQLNHAAMHGNLKQVQQLIADGVDVNAIASCNRTALSLAIQGGHLTIIEALLAAGADPNLHDETDLGLAGNSPLMVAASTFFATNRVTMVRLLIQRGALVNLQNIEGSTALMSALVSSDIDVIQALIEAGTNLNLRDNNSNTALMRAKLRKLSKIVDILQQAGASLEGLQEVELIQAVDRGDIERVKILLQENLNVNARIGNKTALCRAAEEGHHEIAKLLIDAGADVDLREIEGYFSDRYITDCCFVFKK